MLENIRFKDKKALIQYDLNIDIFKNYNFIVEDVIPVRKVFILITNKGNKILKRLNYGIEDLEFIQQGVDYIKKRFFDRVFNYELTKEGKAYVVWKKHIYTVMDLIEARESEYTNPIDVNIASRGLGELHKASEGFRYKNKARYACGNTINSFKRKLEEMELFKNIAILGEDKTEFDNIFLENIDYYKKQIEESIKILEKSNFYKLCSEEDKVVLCHHDLAHHNILIKDEKAYFVDFDYSIIDLKIHDLCNFINKVEKFSAYDIENANRIIENYCESNDIDKRELEVLYGMLVFPQDFYNISKAYYTRTKEWDYDTFLEKLIKKNNFKNDREEFLEKFRTLLS
ncbi:CotS family spore coat protein [Clostridium thermopalmarium]|uniref:Spore coat protein I n=1 Tax=Clostridium thermopalmarium DSM 5974 TaxID=1121340 RepID=A0A2T0AP43_9CLOT|nr:CotS family spore coat protein [Clostridium thermopalmarium]PRR70788.1 Spore coat protein I [Clostridium thermopalmarium DSM 5974]PVZ28712.1 CotS family spore coat protein [Clostridium thermopalmarium DSM 5974]